MIGVYLHPPSMTAEQYKSIGDRVRASGLSEEGMMLHTCFSEGDGVAIFDVWESEAAFEAFRPQLESISQELGITLGSPQYVEMIAYDVR
jgi:hypothetical protein